MPNPPQLALAGSTDFRRRGEQRPSSSPQRLLEGSSGRRYFADFTSVGVVEASPSACWDLIGDTCSWLTSVARVREVPRSRVVSGVFGEHASWDIVQVGVGTRPASFFPTVGRPTDQLTDSFALALSCRRPR